MKKNMYFIVTLLLATTLLFGCGTTNKETTGDNISGPLKREIYKDGSGNIKKTISYTYNDQGLVSTENYIDGTGNVTSYYVYSYDGDGNKISEIKYDADSVIVDRYVYEYDVSGNLTKEEVRNSQNVLNECDEYFYDSNGNKIKYVRRNYKYNIFYDVEYDVESRDVRYTRFDEYGSVTSDNIYSYQDEYDANNVLIKTYKFDASNNCIVTTNYTYDSNNRLIKKESLDDKGVFDIVEYGSNGNIIKQIVYFVGMFRDTYVVLFYNDNGNPVSEEMRSINDELLWTKSVIYYEPGIKAYISSKDETGTVVETIEYEYY